MKRLLGPRLLGIHALGVLGIALCLFLSSWQWSRAHTVAPTTTADGIARFDDLSPLRTYLPVSSIGVRTRVSGHWQEPGAGKLATSNRIILPSRPADGSLLVTNVAALSPTESGAWIVDLLVLSDGSTLAVVRGWSMHPEVVPVASGKVTVFGVMQPSEDSGLSKLPEIDLLTTASITENAHSAVHDGYLVAQLPPHGQLLGSAASAGTSPGNLALVEVSPIIKGMVHQSLHWRNVVYTANWIVFALIVLYMWIRIVRDELGKDDEDDQADESANAELEQSRTD
jgi:hypothetical protein